jgi:putative long chain acyl-CoA synthase
VWRFDLEAANGSAPVRIAAWDLAAGKLVERDDGFARPCGRGEVGMLLVASREDRGGLLAAPVRGVFAKDDEWIITGDLFRRDRDGDYWIVDHSSGLIATPHGRVPSYPIAEALDAVASIDLAVAYALDGSQGSVVVAAVAPRPGHTVHADELTQAVRELAPTSRPAIVRVVDDIPVTTWYRPVKGPLRAAGLPVNDAAFAWNDDAQAYVPLTDAARADLGLDVPPSLF